MKKLILLVSLLVVSFRAVAMEGGSGGDESEAVVEEKEHESWRGSDDEVGSNLMAGGGLEGRMSWLDGIGSDDGGGEGEEDFDDEVRSATDEMELDLGMGRVINVARDDAETLSDHFGELRELLNWV